MITRCLRERVSAAERGFVLVLAGISMFVLTMLVGFGVDLGSWYLNASKLQRASDAATLAAAAELPDMEAARLAALEVYERNGFKDGGRVSINVEAFQGGVKTSVRDNEVPTYFLKMFMPRISIGRESFSPRSTSSPMMGSPFNVLGTGDLNIPGLPRKQNFWLAVSGVCSPKEDGDYFSARYDRSKGPLKNELDANNNYKPETTARHNCPDPRHQSPYPKNEDFSAAGYSYFIDVPKPPARAGSNPEVSVMIYDPDLDTSGVNNYQPPDFVHTFTKDQTRAWGDTAFQVFDANGTPNSPTDDSPIMTRPSVYVSDDHRVPRNGWVLLYVIPAEYVKDGGLFRVQVTPMDNYAQHWAGHPEYEGAHRGTNSFSIGAFASWKHTGNGAWNAKNPPIVACNSDDDPECPRVFGVNAVSVFNNISSNASGDYSDFYLADITPQFVGSEFNVMLWDPAEGVEGIQLVAPNGEPLDFTFTSTDGGPSSTAPVNYVGTNIIDPTWALSGGSIPTLSNPYIFNDRLLTLRVRIPSEYPSMAVGNDDWLRLRYVINGNSPNDRTTWGLSAPSGGGGMPHLSRVVK